jgi:hypothetical protein
MSRLPATTNIFAIFLATMTTYQAARAQQALQIPGSDFSIPGVAQNVVVKTADVDGSVFDAFSGAKALIMHFKDAVPHTRGPQDISLFRQDAPSVVLILTKDGSGSGSLLPENIILTNFHVIGHYREVTVVFKPAAPDVGAHHLLTNPNIRARVAELQQRGAERAEITLESLIREAAELQALAAAAKQYSAANGALKLKAELSGHYMQRKESTVKHAETDWSTDELVAWLANFEASIQRNEEADSGGEVCACATRT